MTSDSGNYISDFVFRNGGGDISASVDTTNDVWSFRVTKKYAVTNEDILMVERINQIKQCRKLIEFHQQGQRGMLLSNLRMLWNLFNL